jgi:4-alpha-glucanotransferase
MKVNKQDKHAKTKSKERGAGILMHISSLPSRYGIGDLGPEAHHFAEFLGRAKQKYWQLLPLNPIEEKQSYSPYSSTSSMAGNTLFISPDLLTEDGMLQVEDLKISSLKHSGKVDYSSAEKIKNKILEKAFRNFLRSPRLIDDEFETFCSSEQAWLDDFALYSIIKELNKGKPWYQWPQPLRERETKALEKIKAENHEKIQRIKWLQFIFFRQWKRLQQHCHSLKISLVGDLPFYISYDSVDVWSNREIFSVDKNGALLKMAGVPPDYFNADGQLWGMPVFNWDVLKKQNYRWWMQRLQKNASLYDIVRLDHFRAFADYWEVPSNEKTAKNGKWQLGPGAEFFTIAKRELGNLPFIAEDLGMITEPVYKLRDKFEFPGMKVLQFAFGSNMSESDYIPHNYKPNFIVYTGTHDNNTTLGWFRKDAGQTEKKNLNRYLRKKITESNVSGELIQLAYSSVAKIAIVPFQDALELDEKSRMNMPASIKNNWLWRVRKTEITEGVERKLASWSELYNRG